MTFMKQQAGRPHSLNHRQPAHPGRLFLNPFIAALMLLTLLTGTSGFKTVSAQESQDADAAAAASRNHHVRRAISYLGADPPAPNVKSNLQIAQESGTRWVRLWISWRDLQPHSADDLNNLDNPSNPLFATINSLDQQIIAARRANVGVILTSWLYPYWANCTNVPTHLPDSCSLEPPQLPGNCSQFPDNDLDGSNSAVYVPRRLGPNDPWGKWTDFLIRRYGYSNETKATLRYVDFLELLNEPNGQMRPQLDANNHPSMHLAVARMFKTGQELLYRRNQELAGVLDAQHQTTLKLAGPALVDSTKSTCLARITPYQAFTRRLLQRLQHIGFVNDKPYFVWTQHSYGDVEFNRLCAPGDEVCMRRNDEECAAPFHKNCVVLKKKCPAGDAQCKVNAAAWVREKLVEGIDGYRWRGWPRASSPQIFLTEGGARLDLLARNEGIKPNPNNEYDAADLRRLQKLQADLVKGNFHLMDDEALGNGIGMVTNYLTYTDPCFDTGLFNFIFDQAQWNQRTQNCFHENKPFTGGDGRPRRIYTEWSKLPSVR